MKKQDKKFTTIDGYIGNFPENVQNLLKKMRSAIRECAPDAEEAISYQMPTFKLNGNLVHFAAYKNHIGFYPSSSGVSAFKNELSGYETSKGTIKFQVDKPIPYSLVKKIVKFRIKENRNRAKKRLPVK